MPSAHLAPPFVIPVLDLMQGRVVRARRGERSRYAPMRSQLCAGSDALPLARALAAVTGSHTLYVADLDAITTGRPQTELLRALLVDDPRRRLWLDAGFADRAAVQAVFDALGRALAERVDPVHGSESLADPAALAACFDRADPVGARAILSLDRRAGVWLDAAGCWQRPAQWPQRVIAMTLERVGAEAGPDVDTVGAVRRTGSAGASRQVIGAGGVRDAADLRAAAASGAAAWLVASALHDGTLLPLGAAVPAVSAFMG